MNVIEKNLKLKVDDSEIQTIKDKVEKLHGLLKEANSLADELAVKEIKISVEIQD